jgi:hypothetical protein
MLRCINPLSADVHSVSERLSESSSVADGRARRQVCREADAANEYNSFSDNVCHLARQSSPVF